MGDPLRRICRITGSRKGYHGTAGNDARGPAARRCHGSDGFGCRGHHSQGKGRRAAVFVEWDAKDKKKVHDGNYEATKLAIRRAVLHEPGADEILFKEGFRKTLLHLKKHSDYPFLQRATQHRHPARLPGKTGHTATGYWWRQGSFKREGIGRPGPGEEPGTGTAPTVSRLPCSSWTEYST
jgi:hypothetical protein